MSFTDDFVRTLGNMVGKGTFNVEHIIQPYVVDVLASKYTVLRFCKVNLTGSLKISKNLWIRHRNKKGSKSEIPRSSENVN